MRAFALAPALVAALVSTCLAHGPQIQMTRDGNGKIVTRRIVSDSNYSTALTDPTSVYVMPLVKFAGVWRAQPDNSVVGWPGFTYGYGYDATTNPEPFPVNSKFILGFTDGLASWSGVAFSESTATEAEAYRGPSNAPTALARTSDDAPFESLMFPGGTGITFAVEGADVHNTVNYRMLGDGSSLSSFLADGIYRLNMRLSSTAELDPTDPVLPSDVFHFVLHKNATSADLSAAVGSLGYGPEFVQFVPEPAGAALLALGSVIALSTSRVLQHRKRR